jgi:importin-5
MRCLPPLPRVPPLLLALPWQVVGQKLTSGDEEIACDLLGVFIGIADSNPRFLRSRLAPVVDAMLTIAQAGNLEKRTRSDAAEVLVSLCEARDKVGAMQGTRAPTGRPGLFGALHGPYHDMGMTQITSCTGDGGG